jgi:hypothetical protein
LPKSCITHTEIEPHLKLVVVVEECASVEQLLARALNEPAYVPVLVQKRRQLVVEARDFLQAHYVGQPCRQLLLHGAQPPSTVLHGYHPISLCHE